MKVNANTLRTGNVIDRDGELWSVIKTETSKPGKGGAVIQIEMRSIKNGNKDKVRYGTQESIERVRLEQDDYQFLFAEGDACTFMNTNTYEQVEISKDLIGDQAKFLQDGMMVTVESFEGTPLGVELPASVAVDVLETEAVVKGQTASSSYKPATVEGDVRVMVPPHIEAGTKIVVRVEDCTYMERAK